MLDRFAIPKKAWLDLSLLTGTLLAVNLLVSRGNIGWLDRQPTPYILLPVLLGVFYGVGAGLVAGGAPFLIALLGYAFKTHTVWGFGGAHQGLLWVGLVLGALCGELQFESQRLRKTQAARNEDLGQRLRTLEDELVSLRRAKDELDRMVALRDREKSSLDTGLRWLSGSSAGQLARNTLHLLNRQARVTDAAIYYLDASSGTMNRQALLGHEEQLPQQFKPGEVEIACFALERKKPVGIPELLSIKSGTRQDHLAAVPFVSSEGEPFGMLLITGMPFTAFTAKTIDLIGLICQWAAGFIELKEKPAGRFRLVEGEGKNRKVYSSDFFAHLVRISARAFQQQHTPASLVLICAPQAPMALQSKLESLLVRSMRAGDYAAQVGLEFPHLVFLLPLTGERGSAVFADRILSAWPQKEYPLTAYKAALKEEGDLQALRCTALGAPTSR